MKETENNTRALDRFVGYEDARTNKNKREIQPATKKAVKAALNRINPDENSQERG